MWHIIISPFGLVRFRHFFLADVLTSIVTPLCMLGIIECFYFGPGPNGEGPDWKIPAKVDLPKECRPANAYYIAMTFIPYWLRFL